MELITSDNLNLVLIALLGISEVLSLFPKIKSNGLFSLVINILKDLKKKKSE